MRIDFDAWARFEKHYIPEPNSGCWLWTGSIIPDGYGFFARPSGSKLAHRFAYEHVVGPIPAGLELDHLCRVRCCVNPAHLEPVTRAENMRRSPIHCGSRTHCPQGCRQSDMIIAHTVKARPGEPDEHDAKDDKREDA